MDAYGITPGMKECRALLKEGFKFLQRSLHETSW